MKETSTKNLFKMSAGGLNKGQDTFEKKLIQKFFLGIYILLFHNSVQRILHYLKLRNDLCCQHLLSII